MSNNNALAVGDKAPDFTAPRDGGEDFSLKSGKDKMTVLYFYPRDDTPGCTKEGIEFTALLPEFEKLGVQIVGVSKDTIAKHDKFRDKHDLGVILVSDKDGTICEDYGVWVEKSMYGKTSMGIERATFLIEKNRKISNIWRKVKAAGHAQAVLDYIQTL